ncbi:MAG: Uma2 family endonuclease [Chloroflexi bacterium]|nr:Uma2 family endonuclease [Chloroflexota bacterium]
MVVRTAETTAEKLISGVDLLEMGNIGRCELVAGRIVMRSPTGDQHGSVEGNFYDVLRSFVRPQRLGVVRVGEVGIYTRRNPDTIRAADVLYISYDRYTQRTARAFLDVAPELIVEVMSPDDRWTDMNRKLQEYFAIGVKLVWVAEPDSRTVYAYRSITDVREFTERDTLPGDDVLVGFSIPVAAPFAE